MCSEGTEKTGCSAALPLSFISILLLLTLSLSSSLSLFTSFSPSSPSLSFPFDRSPAPLLASFLSFRYLSSLTSYLTLFPASSTSLLLHHTFSLPSSLLLFFTFLAPHLLFLSSFGHLSPHTPNFSYSSFFHSVLSSFLLLFLSSSSSLLISSSCHLSFPFCPPLYLISCGFHRLFNSPSSPSIILSILTSFLFTLNSEFRESIATVCVCFLAAVRVLFIFSFSLFQPLLTLPLTTSNLFFYHFFSVTSPTMHLVAGRETTWRDEGSVQHTVPKIRSHNSPAHLD